MTANVKVEAPVTDDVPELLRALVDRMREVHDACDITCDEDGIRLWLEDVHALLANYEASLPGADIASMALLRLENGRATTDPHGLAQEMRAAIRGIFAVTSEHLPSEQALTPEVDVKLSRLARARASQMRAGLGRSRPTDVPELRERLRRFGNALARALSERAFAQKIGRVGVSELRLLQRRIVATLVGDARYDERTLQRLWQDCYSAASILVLEPSQEVAQVDRRDLRELVGRIQTPRPITRSTVQRFKALRGVREDLDELIGRSETDPDVWLDTLSELVHEGDS